MACGEGGEDRAAGIPGAMATGNRAIRVGGGNQEAAGCRAALEVRGGDGSGSGGGGDGGVCDGGGDVGWIGKTAEAQPPGMSSGGRQQSSKASKQRKAARTAQQAQHPPPSCAGPGRGRRRRRAGRHDGTQAQVQPCSLAA